MAKTYQTYRNRNSGMLVGMGRFYSGYSHLELVQVTLHDDGSKTIVPVSELESEVPHPQGPEGQLGAEEPEPASKPKPRPRAAPRSRRKQG